MKTIRETRQMVVDQMLGDVILGNGSNILEPSAGFGDLAVKIIDRNPSVNLYCIELNAERFDVLKTRVVNCIKMDFLKFEATPAFDYVIACPTYKDSVDCDHIMYMYKMLKVGGQVISLTHPIWTIGEADVHVKFRKWLEDKNYSMKMLRDFSFVENFNTQPSMVITITKEKL